MRLRQLHTKDNAHRDLIYIQNQYHKQQDNRKAEPRQFSNRVAMDFKFVI